MIDSLYESASDGNKKSEEELFRYMTDRFRFFVRRRVGDIKDAEDIVQNALIAIAEKYRSIDYQTSFASWAYKVLEYKTLDYFRSRGRHEDKMKNVSEEIQTGHSLDIDLSTKGQMLDCLGKIGEANRRFARILNLHYQGYTSDEICQKLTISKSNFYVVLSRARSMLELCLEKGDVASHE